jgi:Putative auto-transporter adhesin, head GIN domain
MKNFAAAILLMALIAGSVSCKKDVIGEGPVTAQTRTVTSFTGIDLRMNGTVYYTNDTEWKLEVIARESIHPILETKVEGGRLIIRYSNGRTYDADESIRINVSGPGVNRFELNTSGSIYCVNTIQQANLFLRSSGSGSIYMQQVIANNIEAESTVSGRITATGGTTISEKIKTDGSGKIDLSAIAAKNVTARTIGSGDIKVKVADRLDATIDGSGSLYFSGSPLITTDINGSGRLIRF